MIVCREVERSAKVHGTFIFKNRVVLFFSFVVVISRLCISVTMDPSVKKSEQ